MSSIRAAALSSAKPAIDAAMINEVVALKVEEAKAREAFRK